MANELLNGLNKINNIKNSIKQTINDNGGSISDDLPFSQYNVIISGLMNKEWKPQPDWWDIERIIEEDTEDYTGKMIVLLSDSRDTITLPISYWTIMGADKIRFSDGIEYISPKTEINHTWDKTQDKECSLGYKTRYIIFYWKGDTNFGVWSFSNIFETLYLIHKGMNINSSRYDYQCVVLKSCECIKFINCVLNCNNEQLLFNSRSQKIEFNNSTIINVSNLKQLLNNNVFINNDNVNTIYKLIENENITSFDSTFYNCINLKKMNITPTYTSNAITIQSMFYDCTNLETINENNELDLSNCTNALSSFYHCRKIPKIALKNTEKIENFNNTFIDCWNLTSINEINTQSCTTMSSMFNSCFSLKYVNLTDTSKVTNMYSLFSDCRNLKMIENINFESVSNISNMFTRCYSLTDINNLSNIKISGINFNECISLSHNTLIKIINALYDYVSEGNEETHTITLGSTNLSKLTEEEIAVGTEKGWTIS